MGELEELKIEKLTENQQYVANLIGFDNYKKLMREYGGDSIYFPCVNKKTKSLRNEQIVAEFNGHNYRQLGQKYSLSTGMIRIIVSEERRRMKMAILEGQVRFY